MNGTNWKTAVYASGSVVACGVVLKFLKSNIFSSVCNNDDSPINEVLLYGGNEEGQRKQAGLNNLFCIYYVIVHANRSIDVCVPTLQSETITKCLIGTQKNKVKIRIIVHSSEDSSRLKTLSECGIDVKIIKTQPLEHEFILVDASEDFNEAVVVIGSLDYETSRVNRNRDSTLLTSEVSVIKSLKSEFERVWNIEKSTLKDLKEINATENQVNNSS